MHYLRIYGTPAKAPEKLLLDLREDIVRLLAGTMNVSVTRVRVFFVPELLPQPVGIFEGSTTVFAQLDTAMFSMMDDALPIAVAQKLAQLMWDAFGGKFEVEVFIGDLHPLRKALIEASST